MLREMIVYSVHGWRHFLVCNTHIAFRLLRRGKKHESMHFLVILSLKTLWAGVKHWRTALHRFYGYRKPISSPRSRVIQKYIHLKCICISFDPHSPFHCHACISYLSFTIFFTICDWGSPSFLCRLWLWLGYFFLFSWP